MKRLYRINTFLCFLLIPIFLTAEKWVKTYSLAPYVGPEIYYLRRTREGGSDQSGVLSGVRVGYDHVRRYKLYWGIDGLWAQGQLKGHKNEDKIKSEFTDINVEARLGYTFQSKYWRCASFTPYLGLGFLWERNFLHDPSPSRFHFRNDFSYVPIGFLSQIFVIPCFSIGLNFKLRYVIEGEQRTSHDPENDKSWQNFTEKLQYRVELPMTYFHCLWNQPLGFSLVPFAEWREYGHRANHPYDFLETKLRLYGATLKILYLF